MSAGRRPPLPESATAPLVAPLALSVAYVAESPDALDALYEGHDQGFSYAREGHPNAAALGADIAAREGLAHGVVTGSGMAAIGAALLATLGAGDHLLAGAALYGRSLRLLREDLPRLGIATSLADATDARAMEAALRPQTRAILIEPVSNPLLRVADLEGIAALARARGLTLIVDNTFPTPAMLRPAAHGADIVVHSVTKLLAGHSDATLGWVGTNAPARHASIEAAATTWGMTASPFDCWLAARGLLSFELRQARAAQSAAAIAAHLGGAPGVARVIYPGRPDHPDHARARALFGGQWGNMVSFELRGGRAAANAFVRAARGLAFAPTLGDISSTLSHPASSSHRGLSAEARAQAGLGEGVLRLSVGVEPEATLLAEITAGLAAVAAL